MSLSEPATPYLQVDEARLRANVDAAARRAAAAGVALRPHVKTHKCIEIARMQVEAGAVGITVATLGEAEVFAAAGFDDLFVAYPLWIDEASAERVRALADRATVSFGVDSAEAATNAGRLLAARAAVLVEVDSGHHRTGVAPENAAEVALAAAEAGLEVRGVFTFPGHSYAPDGGRAAAAADEARALSTAAAGLQAAGIEPTVLSGGSTPSLDESDTGVLTELRPGVYVFNDAQQWELGAVPPERIALTARATVVSHGDGRIVLDSGSKVLGADRPSYSTGFGRLLDHPEARIVQVSEHHAVVELPGPLPPLGSRLDVVPNHVCAAVNLVDELWVDGVPWAVAARGRNA